MVKPNPGLESPAIIDRVIPPPGGISTADAAKNRTHIHHHFPHRRPDKTR
jgi:hypothetical protein